MDLREHLKEQIEEDFKLLKEYEDKRRTETDPRLELKWEQEIEKVKQQICKKEEELKSFTTHLKKNPAYTTSLKPVPSLIKPKPEVELVSVVGVDYSNLYKLLVQKKWKKANDETHRIMEIAVGQELSGNLDCEHIQKFPCEDLHTIDQLWVKSSQGRFGFSVQKRIWLSLGGKPGVYDYKIYYDLKERVGHLKVGGFFIWELVKFGVRSTENIEGYYPDFWYGIEWVQDQEYLQKFLAYTRKRLKVRGKHESEKEYQCWMERKKDDIEKVIALLSRAVICNL